jgi:hypothetical protein
LSGRLERLVGGSVRVVIASENDGHAPARTDVRRAGHRQIRRRLDVNLAVRSCLDRRASRLDWRQRTLAFLGKRRIRREFCPDEERIGTPRQSDLLAVVPAGHAHFVEVYHCVVSVVSGVCERADSAPLKNVDGCRPLTGAGVGLLDHQIAVLG